jgi:hypothetical protein
MQGVTKEAEGETANKNRLKRPIIVAGYGPYLNTESN